MNINMDEQKQDGGIETRWTNRNKMEKQDHMEE